MGTHLGPLSRAEAEDAGASPASEPGATRIEGGRPARKPLPPMAQLCSLSWSRTDATCHERIGHRVNSCYNSGPNHPGRRGAFEAPPRHRRAKSPTERKRAARTTPAYRTPNTISPAHYSPLLVVRTERPTTLLHGRKFIWPPLWRVWGALLYRWRI